MCNHQMQLSIILPLTFLQRLAGLNLPVASGWVDAVEQHLLGS
jgi:hypothetical protein